MNEEAKPVRAHMIRVDHDEDLDVRITLSDDETKAVAFIVIPLPTVALVINQLILAQDIAHGIRAPIGVSIQ